MKSTDLLREILDKRGRKTVADKIATNEAVIHKWFEEGRVDPLKRVVQLIEATKDERIISWLCEQASGFFVRNGEGKGLSRDVSKATATIVQHVADVLGIIAKAAEDNSVTEKESEPIRVRWNRLKTEMESFVTACEKGQFKAASAMPQRSPK